MNYMKYPPMAGNRPLERKDRNGRVIHTGDVIRFHANSTELFIVRNANGSYGLRCYKNQLAGEKSEFYHPSDCSEWIVVKSWDSPHERLGNDTARARMFAEARDLLERSTPFVRSVDEGTIPVQTPPTAAALGLVKSSKSQPKPAKRAEPDVGYNLGVSEIKGACLVESVSALIQHFTPQIDGPTRNAVLVAMAARALSELTIDDPRVQSALPMRDQLAALSRTLRPGPNVTP